MSSRIEKEAEHAAQLRTMPDNASTRERILDVAETLLQQRGFNAFSYKHIAEQLGMRHAAVHYHFPAKEDLGIALVQRYRARYDVWRSEVEARAENAWQCLEAYFGMYLDYLNCGHQVCPAGVLGNDFQSLPDAMREEGRLLLLDNYGWLTSVLERGRSEQVLHFVGPPEAKALCLGASLQGALQIDRVSSEPRFFQVIQQIETELLQPITFA